MDTFDRITFDPAVMGGRACIRGMRITVALVLTLIQIGPVDVDAVANQSPIGALGIGAMTQPRVPGQRRTHFAALGSTYNRGESTPTWHALSRSYLFSSLATTPSASPTSDSSQQ